MNLTSACRACIALLVASTVATPARAQRLIAVDSQPGSANVWELDAATGARTLLGPMSPAAAIPAGLAYDMAAGKLYMSGTGTDSLYVVDVTDWQASLVGPFGSSAIIMHGLEWDSSTGTLYGMSAHNSGLYTIDTTTGAATLVGVSGLPASTSVGLNLGYDIVNNVMFMTSLGTDSLYTIDRTTGLATLVGPMTGTTNVSALAFHLAGLAMYAVDNLQDQLYRLDLATGTPTLVGPVGLGNMIGLVSIDGAGRLARQSHACGPTKITPLGHPNLGGTVSFTLGGITGFPFVGFGFANLAVPFCGCTVGHDWIVANGGASTSIVIPTSPAFIGFQLRAQGLDFLGTGGCPDPMLTLSDTITLTIG